MSKLSANELLDLLDCQWLTKQDIAKIGGVGLTKALEIKNQIKSDIEKQGYFTPRKFVPTEYVIKYFNINIKYLKKVAKGE